jgi:hypothetical protein
MTHEGAAGSYDAFIAKVNASGTDLVYCSFIGGSGEDHGQGIAVDGSGRAYVVGYTSSGEGTFPVRGGLDTTYNGGTYDAFIMKVNADGYDFAYCGYIGGSGEDKGYGIAVDGSGNAYVTGTTFSSEASFPVKGGPDLTLNGSDDAFVAKINPSGTDLLYCGYIGSGSSVEGYGIAVDGTGNAYITGYVYANGTNFPATVGPDLTYNGGSTDAFVAKVVVDAGFYVIPKRTGGGSVIYLE